MNNNNSSVPAGAFVRFVRKVGETSRVFVLLAVLTFSLLAVVGTAMILQMKLLDEPILSMKGLAPAMSSPFFADMIGMELPGFTVEENREYTFSNSNVITFLLQLLTNVNPRDHKSLLAGEVPGIRDDTVPLRRGKLTDQAASPADYAPPAEVFADNPAQPEPAEPQPKDPPKTNKNTPVLSTKGKKVVFIYHTHNRESWLPELKSKGITDIDSAHDSSINISLVGKRLSGKLEDLGIGTSHSATDYPTAVKSFKWVLSYKYSQSTVKTAFASNPDLTYFFDIHRDSQRRDLTTATINGKAYAQIYFIIGHQNPSWRKNEEFATQIHDVLQEKYPGLSRGIWGKGARNGNGEYNQSISPNSILIEIGGPENTLEESYRTADVLADVIAGIYWDAEKVNAGG